jgi:hypothetical protein
MQKTISQRIAAPERSVNKRTDWPCIYLLICSAYFRAAHREMAHHIQPPLSKMQADVPGAS